MSLIDVGAAVAHGVAAAGSRSGLVQNSSENMSISLTLAFSAA
jgi:hypothetical protein